MFEFRHKVTESDCEILSTHECQMYSMAKLSKESIWKDLTKYSVPVHVIFNKKHNFHKIISTDATNPILNILITPKLTINQTSSLFLNVHKVEDSNIFGFGFSTESHLLEMKQKLENIAAVKNKASFNVSEPLVQAASTAVAHTSNEEVPIAMSSPIKMAIDSKLPITMETVFENGTSKFEDHRRIEHLENKLQMLQGQNNAFRDMFFEKTKHFPINAEIEQRLESALERIQLMETQRDQALLLFDRVEQKLSDAISDVKYAESLIRYI